MQYEHWDEVTRSTVPISRLSTSSARPPTVDTGDSTALPFRGYAQFVDTYLACSGPI